MNVHRRSKLDHFVINKEIAQNTIQCTIDKMKIQIPTRSAGDGMEQSESQPLAGLEQMTNNHKTYEARSISPNTFEIPHPVKRKEPKFVPYEPYKAAITPIVPPEETKVKSKRKSSKSGKAGLVEQHIPFPLLNNPNLSPVIRVLRDNPLGSEGVNASSGRSSTYTSVAESFQTERDQWEEERMKFEEEIAKLKNGKRDMENQFKVQTQVNAELKKLLVASLGEDMQSRVQFLSEDKARLAQDIAQYSQMLLDEHEELEKLAIQCDVWRSKFLACSLMVDELAGWKALLSRKYDEAKESIQWLIEERDMVKQHSIATQQFLKHLQMVFDPAAVQIPKRVSATNLLTIAHGNHKLADAIHYRLLGSSGVKLSIAESVKCEGNTPAEDLAFRVLSTKEVLSDNLNTLEKVENINRLKMCRFHSNPPRSDVNVSGCRHCSGDIDVI